MKTDRVLSVSELPDAAAQAFLSPARWPQAPHNRLADHHFEVRECVIRGSSRIYADGVVRPPAVGAEAEFATRVLIMQPTDIKDFSGTVHIELLNPSTGVDFPMYWPDTASHLIRRGDAYVGITCKSVTAESLSSNVPNRYSGLHIDHDGAVFDLLDQVARAARSDGPERLLAGLPPARTVIATGWSQSGSMLRTYISEGLHEQHCEEAGTNTIDAFLIGVSSGGFGPMGYVNVDRHGEMEWDENLQPTNPFPQLAMDDPRRVIRGSRVPTLELMSEDEARHHLWHQRPDSDAPGDLYRCYQIPARGHETGLLDDSLRVADHGEMPDTGMPPDLLPVHRPSKFLLAAAVEHLVDWVNGQPAPRADPIAVVPEPGARLDPEGFHYETQVLADRHGHALGGLRYLEVDLPIASMSMDSDGPITVRAWRHETWGADRLAREYGSSARLRRLAIARCEALVTAGTYLPEDASAAVEELCNAAGDF